MQIIHFTLGRVNPDSSNGINKVIEGLAKHCNNIESNSVKAVTLKRNQTEKFKEHKRDGFDVISFRSIHSIIRYLIQNKKNIDLIHMHNAWNIYNVIVGIVLKKSNIPYVITPHAAFSEDRVKNSSFYLKCIFQKCFQKSLLNNAAGLHAIAREEIMEIYKYCTYRNNIFYVPNGINLSNSFSKSTFQSFDSTKIHIGYLGRISHEKNIEGLIEAIKELPLSVKKLINVTIAGPIDDYANRMIDLCKRFDIESTINFTGELNKEQKWSFLNSLNVYIQPSFSEGASISILEAMYSNLPIIASRTCKVSYLNDQDFLVMVEPIPKDIARGIEEVVTNYDFYREAGKKGKEYVSKYYDWQKIAIDLVDQYQKIINK